ncbi:hypothetical protein BT93_C1634 [Corymbia citriodora subsp. variegata]|nr:hypothetical protein BT93_C1634 [Corymbia citriodora subsp. variegata]
MTGLCETLFGEVSLFFRFRLIVDWHDDDCFFGLICEASGCTNLFSCVAEILEGFAWSLFGSRDRDNASCKPHTEDVFMDVDEDEAPVPDETIREAAVGKGLSGDLKLLRERGTLQEETVEWSGRNMDKKKSKLEGIADHGQKEICIERTDEFGRVLTLKESFRLLSHKFHGKGPGKRKQEKPMKQYREELKLKQMKNSDTPSLSAERMRELRLK